MMNQITKCVENTGIKYPIRINKYMCLTGICSRRKADKLIEQKQVFVNGRTAKLGQKINKEDKIHFGPEVKKMRDSYEYYLYHKPVGIVSHNPKTGEIDAVTHAGLSVDFAPVGRLDKLSEGLMLLTNDGRIVNKILNPNYEHEKEYIVTIDKPIKNFHINLLRKGVDIEGYITKSAKISKLSDLKISMILTEGKKHQIRRMLAALGYEVLRLQRVRIMHLRLGELPAGSKRKLNRTELSLLMKSINLDFGDYAISHRGISK